MIQATSGAQPNQEFVELVHSRTEGNPLFISEVVRMLEQEGGVAQERSDLRIPEGVREVIGRRLNRLTEQCNQELTVASVIGREFEFDPPVRLVEGVSEDGLLESLEEAVSARVIEEILRSVGRYQFTHALIRQTLMDELSATRRVRLSVRIIEMIEELYGDGIEAHAAELAYHAAEAEALVGPDKLLHYSIMAGGRALESFALEDALGHFQRALDAREDQTMDDQLATIKFGLGRVMIPTVGTPSEAQPAWDALSQAFDYYVEQGGVEKAVNVATHPVPLALVTGVADLQTRALKLVPKDSLRAGYLLYRLAGALIYELSDFEGALAAATEATTIARRENDEFLEARSLSNSISPLLIDHRPYEAIDVSLKSIEIAQRIGDLRSLQSSPWVLAQALLTVGEPDRAKAYVDSAFQAAEKLHDRVFQTSQLLVGAYCAAYQGDWSKAGELAHRSEEILPNRELSLGLEAEISLDSNDVEAAERLIDKLSSDPNATIHVSARLIRAAYETGNNTYMDLGEAILISGSGRTNGLQSFWIEHYAAISAALRNDAATGADHYSALARDKGTILYPSLFCADHILGLLAHVMGNLDAAQTHFEDAITFCRKANYRPELPWTLYDYADMIIQRSGSGGLSKARELSDEADRIASNLSMARLHEKVVALKEQLDARPSPKPEYPDGMTGREVEVLRLIASGRTNQRIADELVISLNTVLRHVSNIFGKTGSANRADATMYAARKGLASLEE